jgi:hypothetical protein
MERLLGGWGGGSGDGSVMMMDGVALANNTTPPTRADLAA